MSELYYIKTQTGAQFFFNDATAVMQAVFALGAPPPTYFTRRGYRQIGETVVDFTLQPRPFSFQIYRGAACSRTEYWARRAELLDLLRQNQGGAFEFGIVRSDGTTRALRAYISNGPLLDMPLDAQGWDISEAIDCIAHDPLWYDPQAMIISPAQTGATQLVFPATFPIEFGFEGVRFDTLITYLGTWETFPVLRLGGPYTRAVIENLTTGVSIEMAIPILAGEKRIITLTRGSQSITDAAGDPKFDELSPSSDLVNFALRPAPQVAGGAQQIRATFYSATITSPSGWYQAVIDDSPVRWYRLGEFTGPIAAELIGGQVGTYTGVYTNAVVPGLVPGDPDLAAQFTRTGGGHVVIPAIDLTVGDWSFECWIFPNYVAGAVQGIFQAYGGLGLGDSVEISLLDTGLFFVDYLAGSNFSSVTPVSFFTTTHFVYTYSASLDQSKIYVNGVLDATSSVGPMVQPSPSLVTLGRTYATDYYEGILDECVFYDTALTAARVAAHWDARNVTPSRTSPASFEIEYNTRYFGI